MHDRVQAMARVLVVEDELTQPGAIDAPVAHVLGTELANDGLESRTAGLVHGVGRVVRVDDGRADLFEHRGDGGLPRPGAARQPDELHFGGMADEAKFDAVVVGAGPAGAAGRTTMANAGPQGSLGARGAKPRCASG